MLQTKTFNRRSVMLKNMLFIAAFLLVLAPLTVFLADTASAQSAPGNIIPDPGTNERADGGGELGEKEKGPQDSRPGGGGSKDSKGGDAAEKGPPPEDISKDFGRRGAGGGTDKCGSKDKSSVDQGVGVAIKVGCKGKGNPIYDYARGLIRFLALGVGIVIVGAIIFGGIAYASARGDQAQTKKAIEIITNAGIALVMFLLMSAILNFIIPGGIL